MQRFRFTFLAISLVLIYLGWNDTSLYLRNQQPQTVTIQDLEAQGAPRDWLRVTGGFLDLPNAINTSGTVNVEGLLIPLKSSPETAPYHVLIESRHPRLLELFRTYHFHFDTPAAQEDYLQANRDEFYGQRDVLGTVVTGLVNSGNRDKLMRLAKENGDEIPADVLFISEGNEPVKWRGFLFLGIGLAGLVKILLPRKQAPSEAGSRPGV
jgi:hypothetical protein